MRLLLDTCTFIWLCADPGQLSSKVVGLLDDPATEWLLSDVSAMEISLKWSAGKLPLPEPPRRWIEQQLRIWSVTSLPMTREELYRSTELPGHHRDPVDRLLVATAITSDAALVTPDRAIHAYPVSCVW